MERQRPRRRPQASCDCVSQPRIRTMVPQEWRAGKEGPGTMAQRGNRRAATHIPQTLPHDFDQLTGALETDYGSDLKSPTSVATVTVIHLADYGWAPQPVSHRCLRA